MGIRNNYEKLGVNTFYRINSMSYSNPHESIISENLSIFLSKKTFQKDIKILDLCSGSGEITRVLHKNHFKSIVGLDPFTYELYYRNTNNECLRLSFKDIANGMLTDKFDLIVCSFALHLAEQSMLPNILYHLSLSTNKLIIITPHKKPEIKNFFKLKDEFYKNKVRVRYYEKIN